MSGLIRGYEYYPPGYENDCDGDTPILIWLSEGASTFLDLCSNMTFEERLAYTLMYAPKENNEDSD